jgi:putative membrane protein
MSHTKPIFLTGLIGSAALWGLPSFAQDTGAPSPLDFVTKATVAGKTEVAAAHVALKTSQADDVKAFAKQMIKDHSKANHALASIAKSQNLSVPAHIDAEHRAALGALRSQSGSAFDAAYSKQMLADHADAVALFKSEAGAGSSNSDLSAFAQKTLPTLEHHKSMADALAANHGS